MKSDDKTKRAGADCNPDPITGEPGAHPVATGAGALGAGAAGAAIGGAVGGPVGGAIGAVVGAVAGGFGGKAAGEAIDPTAEDAYWCEQHGKQPYVEKGTSFEDYRPAYQTGYEASAVPGRKETFEEAEPKLRAEYAAKKGKLPWEKARPAACAAWTRVEEGKAVRVPIHEEQVKVGKHEVEAGGAKIRKEVTTETVDVPVELKREEVVVKRTPVSGGEPTDEAFQEGEVRIPVKREEVVVEKTARKTGEVTIEKSAETERRTVSESIRKEDVKVDAEGDAKIRR